MTDIPPLEFSHRIPADSLSREEKIFEIEANATERHSLARRFSLVSLDSMKAKIRLVLQKNNLVHMSGELEANIVQSCVINMKPVQSHIEATFERTFTTTDEEPGEDGTEIEIEIDANTTEPPDRLIDGAVEIGECVAEQLAIEMPPFPRSQGIIFDGFSSGPDEPDIRNPFSELAKIREKLK